MKNLFKIFIMQKYK